MYYVISINYFEIISFSSLCELLVLDSSPIHLQRSSCSCTGYTGRWWVGCQIAAWDHARVMTSRSSSPVDWDRVSQAVSSLRQSRGVVLAWRCVRIPFRTARTWWRRWHIQIFDVFDADYINVTNRDLKSDWVPENNINFHEHPSTISHVCLLRQSSPVLTSLMRWIFAELYNMAILCMTAC